jgi:hypothetical protein
LCDEVEPVVMQSGSELLAWVSRWKLDIETGCKSWESGASRFVSKRFLDAQVSVSKTLGRRIPFSPVNGEIGEVHIDLKAMRQAIVELEVRCVLSAIGVLKLEAVILIEELQMVFSGFRHRRVIGVEGQLGLKLSSTIEYVAERE